MSISTKTDRIKDSIRKAENRSIASTRAHTDALMRDESEQFQKHKERGASCSSCSHREAKGYFLRCVVKDKLVNPLALCHRWNYRD